METTRKNIQIRQHIVRYCNQIETTSAYFHLTVQTLEDNFIARNSICMPIQQIGELANHLDECFKKEHDEIPWRSIIAMRNIFAHDYDSNDPELIWATVKEDIPELKEYCITLLKENNCPIPIPENIDK